MWWSSVLMSTKSNIAVIWYLLFDDFLNYNQRNKNYSPSHVRATNFFHAIIRQSECGKNQNGVKREYWALIFRFRWDSGAAATNSNYLLTKLVGVWQRKENTIMGEPVKWRRIPEVHCEWVQLFKSTFMFPILSFNFMQINSGDPNAAPRTSRTEVSFPFILV